MWVLPRRLTGQSTTARLSRADNRNVPIAYDYLHGITSRSFLNVLEMTGLAEFCGETFKCPCDARHRQSPCPAVFPRNAGNVTPFSRRHIYEPFRQTLQARLDFGICQAM